MIIFQPVESQAARKPSILLAKIGSGNELQNAASDLPLISGHAWYALFMNVVELCHAESRLGGGLFRNAVNPSMGASHKHPCL
jgi:hypothetical protein